MRTPSSSSCQLGLGVVLRCLSLSPYIRGFDSQLGTISGSTVPSSDIVSET